MRTQRQGPNAALLLATAAAAALLLLAAAGAAAAADASAPDSLLNAANVEKGARSAAGGARTSHSARARCIRRR